MDVVVPAADSAITPLDAPPSFSVVVPVYEGAHVVAEAIESLLTQTVAPHEIIVCDDGSTDDLARALSPYAGLLTFLRQEHKGTSAARNLGSFHATGDFVATCDADDVQLPRLIEAFGELAMARPDLDILSRTCFLERDGAPAGVSRTPEKPRFAVEDQRKAILLDNFVPSASAVRRQRLVDVGGFDESLRCAEDYDLWTRLIFGGSRAGLLLEPLAVYRIRAGSLSTHDVWCLQGRIATLTKLLAHVEVSEAERGVATQRLRVYRRRLKSAEAVAEAKVALAQRRPDARRRCLQVVAGPGHGLGTRLKATAGVVAPTWTGRRIG